MEKSNWKQGDEEQDPEIVDAPEEDDGDEVVDAEMADSADLKAKKDATMGAAGAAASKVGE